MQVQAVKSDWERPRLTLITARVSPMVEMARWLLERSHIPYAEEAHAPIVHILATKRAGGGAEVPVVRTAEGVWDGARDFLHGLDAKLPAGERIFPGDEAQRADHLALAERLLALMLQPVRRFVYHALLPYPELITPVATDGAPLWERLLVTHAYAFWRRLMARGLDFSPPLLEQAPRDIDEAFDLVASRLGAQKFLGGDAPGSLDIIFSALAAPLVFPSEYGARLPAIGALPADFRQFVLRMRDRPAGRLALATYAAARGTPQATMKMRRASREIIPPRLLRRALGVLRALTPTLRLGSRMIVLRNEDVRYVLSNDLAFTIGPINAEKTRAVSGDFILGLDRCPRLVEERAALYKALGRVDIAAILADAQTEACRLLDAAAAGSGRIEVVNGYARLVAARTSRRLFGIDAPTEADLMRVVRAIFHETFLDIGNDPLIRERGIAAGHELRRWIETAIIERRARMRHHGEAGGDFLGRLLDAGLDDDTVRRNVAGMLVGSIDTTATAVANIIVEATHDRPLQDAMTGALDNPREMLGWCWEALRRRPHNPLVQRSAHGGAEIGGRPVAEGTTVWAMTLSAMHDDGAFPNAGRLDPARPLDRYLHFGGGLHRCAGLDVNVRQIPLLVGALLARRPKAASRLRFDGPFPDEFVVTLSR